MEQSENAQEEHLRNLQALSKTNEQKMDRYAAAQAVQIEARISEERVSIC